MQQLDQFTPREREILVLMARGYTNQDIADAIVVTVDTVKWNTRNIYSKLSLKHEKHKRRKACQFVRENGLDRKHQQNLLPEHPIPFVGRHAELADIGKRIRAPQVRLITLLAPGGMGKTRLALQCAKNESDHFPDGVHFVPLHHDNDGTDLYMTMLRALRIPSPTPDADHSLLLFDYLQGKNTLLVLDNGEHIDNPNLVNRLLKRNPSITILVAARERLGLSSEMVHVLNGLSYPANIDVEFLNYPAVRFFVACLRRVQPQFEPRPAGLSSLLRVVQFTDGHPLALLLAASWGDVMPVEEIAQQLEKGADLLTTHMKDIPVRQRSIKIVFQSAWDSLTETERYAYQGLSMFHGSFSFEAAKYVTGVSRTVLQSLVRKALVTHDGNGRFSVHELLRQFASKQFQGADEATALRAHYVQYFADIADELWKPLIGYRSMDAYYRLDDAFENLTTAFQIAINIRYYEAIYSLLSVLCFYALTRRTFEQRHRIDSSISGLLENLPNHRLRADLLLWKNWDNQWDPLTDSDEAQAHDELIEARNISADHGESITHSLCEFRLGTLMMAQHAHEQAIDHFDRVVALADKYDLKALLADGMLRRADAGLRMGESRDLKSTFATLTNLYEMLEDWHGLKLCCYLQASYQIKRGQYDLAEHALHDHASICERLDYAHDFPVLNCSARLSFLRGDFDHTRECIAQIKDRTADHNYKQSELIVRSLSALLACVEERYHEAQQLCEDLPTAPPFNNPYFKANEDLWLALICAAMGNFDHAMPLCMSALRFNLVRDLRGDLTRCLPTVAMIYTEINRYEDAIVALELAHHHTGAAPGWLEKWPLMHRLRQRLHDAVGTARYAEIAQQALQTDLTKFAREAVNNLNT